MEKLYINQLDKIAEIESEIYVLEYLFTEYINDLYNRAKHSPNAREASQALFVVEQFEYHFNKILSLCSESKKGKEAAKHG